MTVPAADTDRAIGLALPGRHARGRIVRLGPVLDAILAAHAYPPPIEALLAEALTLAALIGATLKDAGGQLTLQAQARHGIATLLVCDYKGGALRGYVRYDADRLAEAPEPDLFALFGTGHLAITFDQATTGERYQGIVPLDGDSLSAAAEHYFRQSEQIPTLVRVGLGSVRGGPGRMAGGLLLQHLPEGEDGRERLHTRLDHPEWEHVAILGRTMGADELADAAVPLETLVWRLFNEEDEVRLPGETRFVRGCRCSPDHIAQVLAGFALDDRREMADEHGLIVVDCAFCARRFPVAAASENVTPPLS